MVTLGVAGLGKMGLSHFSIVNSHLKTQVAVCDSSKFVLDIVGRYAGVPAYRDYDKMLANAGLDAVIVATPSRLHEPMVRKALERGLHVFCEKPFCLDWRDAEELARVAARRGLINQVGYHYRYAGTFQEMKRLIEASAIGRVTHMLAEAYGPVVLDAQGATWRTNHVDGGGCLYDYAAHPVNLINWCFGVPDQVSGAVMSSIFSGGSDDEVYATFGYASGPSVQLSVNWSDESYRKMSTRITLTGTGGRIIVDRQELQAYLRSPVPALPDYRVGWNAKYTTGLTPGVRFNLRGEEYSAQIDDFLNAICDGAALTPNDFRSAAETDHTLALITEEAGARVVDQATARAERRRRAWFGLNALR